MRLLLSKKFLFILFALILLLSYNHCVYAQESHWKSPLVINVEMSRFMFSLDKAYLEICYAVYPSNLTLVKVTDTLYGSVILDINIRNTQNDSLVVHSTFSIPIIINDTALLKTASIGKSAYMLPFGSYELVIRGYDSQNPIRQDSVRKRFSVDHYSRLPTISDIDLCLKVTESKEKKNLFYKNSYEVVPNPSLLFGDKESPVVFSYAELYNMNPDSLYSVVVGLMDSKGGFVKQKKHNHKYSARNVVDVNFLNINSVQSGKYSYVLILTDAFNHEIARSEKTFYIYNSHLINQASAIISAKSAEFAGLSNDELVDEFRKIQYIASSDDIIAFDKLNNTEARREFLVKFWTVIENGKLGGRNDITRLTYLERVLTADQRYRVIGQTGWHSDRGRVFILYGDPDEVERFQSSENAKPYEIWHYYHFENGVQFIFVDKSGFGEYTLVHSTKRGELQDEGWERNLR